MLIGNLYYRVSFIFLGAIACCGFAAESVRAEQVALYYILDVSGSMWGRVAGETKIEVAKRALTKLIQETPQDVSTALVAYGHRRQGDCADIEELLPLGTHEASEVTAQLGRLVPRGKTPLSDSVSMAANKLKGTSYDSTIVLVSDGIETCDKDPCELTKALKESGAKFRIHVVGFGTGDDATSQLKCIAEAGGGQYFRAANATDLLNSLSEIKQAAISKQEIPVPTSTPVVQELTKSVASVRVKAKGPGRVKLILPSWVEPPYYWKLVNPETGEEKARFREISEQLVPAGEYQLVWRQTEHGAREVALGEVISVESGRTAELALTTALHLVPADWVPAKPYFWMLRDAQSSEEIARFSGSFAPQLVPPGRFQLILRQTEHGASDSLLGEVEVSAGKLNEVPLTSGAKLVPSSPTEAPYRVEFVELDAAGKESGRKVSLREGFGPLALKPASYKVIYQQTQHSSKPMVIVDALEIPAGALVEIEL